MSQDYVRKIANNDKTSTIVNKMKIKKQSKISDCLTNSKM